MANTGRTEWEMEVLLNEYREIRKDVMVRHEGERALQHLAVLLISGAFPLLYTAATSGFYLAFLLAPLAFTVVAWLHFLNSIYIWLLVSYQEERLRPRIQRLVAQTGASGSAGHLVGCNILEFQSYMLDKLYSTPGWRVFYGVMHSVEYGLFIVPSIACIVIFVYSHSYAGLPWQNVEVALLVVDLVIIVLLLVALILLKWRQMLTGKGQI